MLFSRALLFTGLTAFLLASSPGSAQAGPRAGNSSDEQNQKVDRAVVRSGSTTQTVIIPVKPGYRDTLRKALQQHGDITKSEHPLIDGLAVELHSADVDALSEQDWIAGRITRFYDFTRGGVPVAPFDDHGHGTHIAGLIGSSGNGSN